MQDEQQKINDVEASLQKSIDATGGSDHRNTGAATAMIIAPLILSIILALVFLFVSRSHSTNDESGLMYVMSVLFTGGLLGLSLIATAICTILGIASLVRSRRQ